MCNGSCNGSGPLHIETVMCNGSGPLHIETVGELNSTHDFL